MRHLDFQVSKVATPAHDLSYFLLTSSPKRILDNLDKYLQMYYKSMSEFLKELGSDPEVLYPHPTFMEHWKRHARFGFTMALFGFRFFLCEEDEAPDMSSKEAFARTMNDNPLKNQAEYDRRVIDVSTMFVKMGLA